MRPKTYDKRLSNGQLYQCDGCVHLVKHPTRTMEFCYACTNTHQLEAMLGKFTCKRRQVL